MRTYYEEYPTGEFKAVSDEMALKISRAKVLYRESDSVNGEPFVILREEIET